MEIINYFCEIDNNEEIHKGEIDTIKNEINTIIKDNIDFFTEFNLDINENNIENFEVPDIILRNFDFIY